MTVCPVTTPAAPQGAPTTPAAPAPAATPPVPTPPPSAPAAPAVPTAPASTQPAEGTPLNLTQERFDALLKERLERAQQSWETAQNKRLATAFGVEDPKDVDPVKALEQAQQQTSAAVKRADRADARSLAAMAGVQPAHVETFLKLVDLGPLKDIDRSNSAAVAAAIQQSVDAALTAAPMFKGSTLPAASGGDRQTPGQPTIDEQIAAAQKNGDLRLALALKRQKAFQQPG